MAKYRVVDKENMKEGDNVTFCGFHVLRTRELKAVGLEPDYYFVEIEENETEDKNE